MLEPLADYLVVKPEEEKKAVGGIDLPDTIDPDAPQSGVVTSKGPEAIIEVGSRVIFRKFSPDVFTLEGEKYLLLAQKDIIAKIV